MLNAAWDWYYGSTDEEIFADCKFNKAYDGYEGGKTSKSKLMIRQGTLASGDSVNVFTKARRKTKGPCYLDLCAKHLRVLRHPNILRFIGCIPVESEVHLVTELAAPLSTVDNCDANEICSGLYDIALALQFLHDKAKVTHNNLSSKSLYVTKSGVWKLGNFEHASHFLEANEEQLKFVHKEDLIVPPEEKGGSKVKLPHKNENAHCRDVYAFGLLLQQYSEQLRFATLLTKAKVGDLIDDLLRLDYENRPTMTEVLTMPLLHSTYIEIVNFLQSVTLKSNKQKEDFFRNLLQSLKDGHIFAEVVAKRIVPLLLTPVVLSDQCAVKHVIQHILKPVSETGRKSKDHGGGVLPESVFARYVIPKIVELFHHRLLHVRMTLVEHFSKYVHLFEKSVLNDVVLPEILLGLSDSNNQLVQGSLRALADAVPVVGGDVIVGAEREKIFSHGVPKFDGRALNESQILAFETKLPPRKKLSKKTEEKKKEKKMTLLELAKMRNNQQPASVEDIQRKQTQMASSIEKKSNITSNQDSPKGTSLNQKSTVLHETSSSAIVNSVPLKNGNKPEPDIRIPEVETWASSDDEPHDVWLDFDTPDPEKVQETDQTNLLSNSDKPVEDESPTLSSDEESEFINSPINLKTASSQIDSVIPNTQQSNLNKSPRKLQLTKKKTSESHLTVSNKKSATITPNKTEDQVNEGADKTKSTLGNEFEIKVKKVDQVVVEPDFFADMEPEIKAVSVARSTTERGSSQQHRRSEAIDNLEIRSVDSGRGSLVSAFNAVDDGNVGDGWDDNTIAWEQF